MILPLIITSLAAAPSHCVQTARTTACPYVGPFECPPGPKWKKTPQGCWDGHRLWVVKSVTHRTTTDVVGHRHR